MQLVEQTAPGLRNALFELLDGLRDGSTKPAIAKAQCVVAERIMDTVRMEHAEIRVIQEGMRLQQQMVAAERMLQLEGEVENEA